MKTDVVVGARTLKCAGKLAKTDIVLKYTADSTATYQTITTSGTFTVPAPYNRVQFFVVGGGGGGGSLSYNASYQANAFGGGGGGYVKKSSEIVTSQGTQYTLTIGAGGAVNKDGSTTGVYSGSAAIVTATGGKAGGSPSVSGASYIAASSGSTIKGWTGGAGGSGGGGGRTMGGTSGDHYYTVSNYNTSSIKYSYNGSNGNPARAATTYSASGVVATAEALGSGSSTADPWTTSIIYSGGGGGGTNSPTQSRSLVADPSSGGGRGCTANKNASNGSSNYTSASAGTANTGGGGGGGALHYNADDSLPGAAGGSGVIRIKLWEA